MGKKTKVGKQRKDVFYNLAKETGYRSRAAFKLIQLNRKFQFLEKTRICVDLCAAPGGWMQVARQFMPVSSFVIGIDLDSIKPIHNCQSFRCDITTEECRTLLRRELKTWKADTFLNDGAPNVGKSWDHDAFMQNCLTLSALKLATEFLNKGGYFVTKIFRSKDYNALIWVLNKLFRRVHATKPKASRLESAEIFVVCEDFLAPDHIDPKFFQSNYLFKDVQDLDESKKAKKEFLKPVQNQKKAKATGYDDNNLGSLNVRLTASEFINSRNQVELLSKANEVVFDDPAYLADPLTNDSIKEYCKDIKVLSRKEILEVLRWQRAMRQKHVKEEVEDASQAQAAEEIEDNEIETEESAMDKLLKKRKKKVLKEKRKLIERMNLKMVHKGDALVEEDEDGLFSLKALNKKQLNQFETEIEDEEDEKLEFEGEDDDQQNLSKYEKKALQRLEEHKVTYVDRAKRLNLGEFDTEAVDSDEEHLDEFGKKLDESKRKQLHKSKVLGDKISTIQNKLKTTRLKEHLPNFNDNDEEEFELSDDAEEDDQISDAKASVEEDSGLMMDLGTDSKLTKTKMFFEQGLLKNANFDDDIEFDLIETEKSEGKKKGANEKPSEKRSKRKKDQQAIQTDSSSDESEKAEPDEPKKKPVKLDASGLALGTLMKRSAKTKRDIENEGWNRYTRGDEDLPSWFAQDEAKHFRKPVNVPENLVQEYRTRLSDINVRTCKKVAEAKARKKRKAVKVMEKLRKKTEAITDNDAMTEKEKVANIKKLYKNTLKDKKKKPALVVAKRGRSNNRRPKGVKGKYKMVDARLKKDKRGQQKQTRMGKKQPVKKRLPKKSRPSADLD